jgi:hypothetical protein
MAVLVEAISVLVKVAALEERFPGSWEGFRAAAPNATLCSDGEIARLGFMAPQDVEACVKQLERHGLVFLADGIAVDIAVADQQRGLTTRCDWIECGQVTADGNRIAAARLAGSEVPTVATPVGWSFEGSLSQTFGFVPGDDPGRALDFVRSEDGAEIYRSRLTGKLVHIGRPAR